MYPRLGLSHSVVSTSPRKFVLRDSLVYFGEPKSCHNKCDRVHWLNCDALDVPTFICIILGHDGVGVLEKLANKDALKHFLHAVVGSESAHQKARLR